MGDATNDEVPFTEPTLKPLFFEGEEAMREVARPDGLWNWALVGPDPDKLPLSGGGSGSIDEMRYAIGKQATSFGLLRMTFGTGNIAKTKFIYINASNIDDDNAQAFSMKERSQALAKAPLMERAVQKFRQTQVKVQITRTDECTFEHINEKLVKVSFHDQHFLTKEKFDEAMEEFREAHPMTKEEEEKEAEGVALFEELAPAPENHEPEPEEQPLKTEKEVEPEPEVLKVRKKVKLFKPGDIVMVWSAHTNSWNDDGEIIERLAEPSSHHGVHLNPGSVKVVYNGGKRFKWVDPRNSEKLLFESTRPRPPPFKQGNLSKETHSVVTRWHERYFELSKGFLHWWHNHDEAARQQLPVTSIPLLGLSLKVQGNVFSFWTHATQCMMFTLAAANQEEANEWAKAMVDHCAFTQAMKERMEKRRSDRERHEKEDKSGNPRKHRHHKGHSEEGAPA